MNRKKILNLKDFDVNTVRILNIKDLHNVLLNIGDLIIDETNNKIYIVKSEQVFDKSNIGYYLSTSKIVPIQAELLKVSKPTITVDKTYVKPGDTVLLQASGSHSPESSNITYHWILPNGIEQIGEQIVYTIPTTLNDGDEIIISCYATDDLNNKSPIATITLHVVLNYPPIINNIQFSAETLFDNTDYTVIIDATDPEGSSLTYNLTCDEPSIIITQDSSNPNIFTISIPKFTSTKSVNFTVEVSDGDKITTVTVNKIIYHLDEKALNIDSGYADVGFSINQFKDKFIVTGITFDYVNTGTFNPYLFTSDILLTTSSIEQKWIKLSANDGFYKVTSNSQYCYIYGRVNNVFVIIRFNDSFNIDKIVRLSFPILNITCDESNIYINSVINNHLFLAKLDLDLSIIVQKSYEYHYKADTSYKYNITAARRLVLANGKLYTLVDTNVDKTNLIHLLVIDPNTLNIIDDFPYEWALNLAELAVDGIGDIYVIADDGSATGTFKHSKLNISSVNYRFMYYDNDGNYIRFSHINQLDDTTLIAYGNGNLLLFDQSFNVVRYYKTNLNITDVFVDRNRNIFYALSNIGNNIQLVIMNTIFPPKSKTSSIASFTYSSVNKTTHDVGKWSDASEFGFGQVSDVITITDNTDTINFEIVSFTISESVLT